MRKLLPFVLLFALHMNLFSQCADSANVYTFTYGGKVYEVIRQTMTWADAAACAVERGGYLVEVNDEAEQAAVYDAIINGAAVSPTYTTIANGGGIAYVWIGATDQQAEGTWLWDGNNDNTGINFWTGQGSNGAGDGAPVGGAYHNWGGKSTGVVKEPDNFGGGQHHAAIALSGWPSGTTMLGIAGEWNDIIGSSLLYFVVEKDSGTIGMNAVPELRTIECWPNPARGKLFFSEECSLVEVYSICGRLLRQYFNTREIPTDDLAPNIYFIRMTAGERVVTRRIVVN